MGHEEQTITNFFQSTPTTLSLEMVFVSNERMDFFVVVVKKEKKIKMETVMREQKLSAVSISVTSQDPIFMY